MLVKIEKKEINAVKYACGLCDFRVKFYTIESTVKDRPDTVQAEILDEDGHEPSITMAWYLARQIETKLACEAFANKK